MESPDAAWNTDVDSIFFGLCPDTNSDLNSLVDMIDAAAPVSYNAEIFCPLMVRLTLGLVLSE
jgi:hypothetical protein